MAKLESKLKIMMKAVANRPEANIHEEEMKKWPNQLRSCEVAYHVTEGNSHEEIMRL